MSLRRKGADRTNFESQERYPYDRSCYDGASVRRVALIVGTRRAVS